jgi:uncharacterized membrane protein YqjE
MSPHGLPDALRILRSAGSALFEQALLHGELARIECAQESMRLERKLLIALLGFACLLCTLLFTGALVLAAAWDTSWRLPVIGALVLLHALATALAYRRFSASAPAGGEVFAESRRQLAADAALLKARA